MVPYTPPQEVLERYARVLVDFALGGGTGIKPGDVVRVAAPECAPLYVELNRAVWRAGGHVMAAYQPDDDGGATCRATSSSSPATPSSTSSRPATCAAWSTRWTTRSR